MSEPEAQPIDEHAADGDADPGDGGIVIYGDAGGAAEEAHDEQPVEAATTAPPAAKPNAVAKADTTSDEAKIVKIQALGRRKIAYRKAQDQKRLRDEIAAAERAKRSAPIAMPVDALELAAQESARAVAADAEALRHPPHPFSAADPSRFVVKDRDNVAAGMQRVYRRMLQSKTWW
jgi:hypothetical protein